MPYSITVWFLPKFLNFSTLGCVMNSDHYTLEMLYYKCQHTLKVSTPAGPPCITGTIAPKEKRPNCNCSCHCIPSASQRQISTSATIPAVPSEYACPIPELIISLIVSSLACLVACFLPSFLVYAFPGYTGQLSAF